MSYLCSSYLKSFLLHWSFYELALAAAVIVDGHMLPTALAVGIAVPVLLLGVLGYRHDRQAPPYAFFVLFAAIALPGYGLAEFVNKTYGLIFLAEIGRAHV